MTAGFGAEIAATVASDCFWQLDAPVERLAVEDVPLPYHPVLLGAVLPDATAIAPPATTALPVNPPTKKLPSALDVTASTAIM